MVEFSTGRYTLTRVFQFLAQERLDTASGVFAYAKVRFGDYLRFLRPSGIFPAPASAMSFTASVIGCAVGIHGFVTGYIVV
jgi:hypothetical protein